MANLFLLIDSTVCTYAPIVTEIAVIASVGFGFGPIENLERRTIVAAAMTVIAEKESTRLFVCLCMRNDCVRFFRRDFDLSEWRRL